MFKRFISYYKPHKALFAMDLGASFFVAVIGVLYPMITRKMLNDYIPVRDYRMIVIAGCGLLALYGIRMGLNYFSSYQGHMMGVYMQNRMRADLFRHLECLPFSFFDKHETGKIMSRMTTDLFDMVELSHHGPENVIISLISLAISFIYLGSINMVLTLIIFACVPILIGVSALTRQKMKVAFKARNASNAVINAALESSISGIRVTKAFTNREKEEEKFKKGTDEFTRANRLAYKSMASFHSSSTFVTDIFNVVVLIAGGLFLYNDKINFADYSAFIVSINLFISPITTLIRFMEMFQNGVAGFGRFCEVMDTEPEVDKVGAADVERLQGNIEFRNVSYGYGDETEVLHGVNLQIGKGQTFALVGPSGGGKTTICHLIPHFYNIRSGEIIIDGQNIDDITMESLRRNIGIVQQDIYLFNASVRENILYGRLDATEEEVIEAAKRANIHEFIMSMEQGYDTVIGERGVRLSGGQKQRLCIARVFLKNPPILILDEATSALDNATEVLIQQALDDLCEGRTTVVVAHRLSTIQNADEIAVIDRGRILERGTHTELVEQGGLYASLYLQQYQR